MPNWAVTVDPRWCRWLGLAGSAALATGGTAAGALPVGSSGGPLHGHPVTALLAAGLGTALLTGAWLLLGRSVHGGRPPGPAWLTATLAGWAAPLLPGPLLFSRDVYSYLAQGAMAHAGLDVYADGPAALGGPTAAEVPEVWQHSPAPYGPVALLPARIAFLAAGGDAHTGVVVLRAVAVLAWAAVVVMVPLLARGCGVRPEAALWLGALNPLVLLHVVAGAHNDALLLALLAGGLLAAQRRHAVTAVVLVTLAGLVKAPALLALPVVALPARPDGGPAARRPRPYRRVFGAAGAAIATTVLVTAVAGTGYGWLGALGTPVSAGGWSPVTALGRVAGAAADPAHRAALVTAARWGGTVLAAAIVLGLAGAVVRGRLAALHALGAAFAAVVLLGPALRPWYALWALLPLAVAAPERGRQRGWAAAGATVLALSLMPDGFTPQRGELLAMAGGAAAGAVVVAAVLAAAAGRGRSAVGAVGAGRAIAGGAQ